MVKDHTSRNMKTILVVDDETLLREALAEILRLEDFHVVCCESGETALEILKNNTVDFVLSDMRMPHGDGLFLLKEIKKHNLKTKVLIMTGFSEITKAEILDLGGLDLIPKPLDVTKILHYFTC